MVTRRIFQKSGTVSFSRSPSRLSISEVPFYFRASCISSLCGILLIVGLARFIKGIGIASTEIVAFPWLLSSSNWDILLLAFCISLVFSMADQSSAAHSGSISQTQWEELCLLGIRYAEKHWRSGYIDGSIVAPSKSDPEYATKLATWNK